MRAQLANSDAKSEDWYPFFAYRRSFGAAYGIIPLRWGMVMRRQQRRLRGIRVLLLLGVLGLVYLATLVVRIYLAGTRDERGPADIIIVLGAAEYDGRPSPVFQARLDHALELYADGYAPYLLITGGRRPGDRFTEAEAGARYAERHRVPASAIYTEAHGRTTMQSLQACTEILRQRELHSAILVSDPFHAFRLRRMAQDLGMTAMVSPAEHSRVRSLRTKVYFIAREMCIYAVYRLFGV